MSGFNGGFRDSNNRRGPGGWAGGRGNQQARRDNNPAQTENPLLVVCKFFLKGTCKNGSNCRYDHATAGILFAHQAHQQSIKSLAVMNLGDNAPPKILTGSVDGTVKVWSIGNQAQCEGDVATKGRVNHVEVNAQTVMWSVDEPLTPEQPDVTVGTVYLLNNADMSQIPVRRSDELPYTHSMGEIRSFTIAVVEASTFLITAGGDGMIRTWKFDPTTSKFEQLAVFEGHVRAVTSLILHEGHIWSGSLDRTIRVWDAASGRCVGSLTSSSGGHSSAVSSLCLVPGNPDSYIASGGAEGDVKLWKPTGEFVHSCSHPNSVTSMCVFQDDYGGVQTLLIGLADGSIAARACTNMSLIFQLDGNSKPIWSIVNLGRSCFVAGGDDGRIVLWKVARALPDKI